MANHNGGSAWRQMTPRLIFNTLVFLQGALLFGIDTGSFGSLQALPAFLTRFGELSGKKHVLPATRKSLMNSLPWIGKFTGCFSAEPIVDRWGFKTAMYILAVIQIGGLIIELTAHSWAQFTVGRIVTYFAVGIVENAVPSYNAECSPAAVRGLISGSIMTMTALGNLWGSGMSRAYATETGQKGWIIPTSMQFIPALGILLLVPWTPESPRWLLAKGRKDEAKVNLDKIRHKHEVESGQTIAELDVMKQLVEQSAESEKGGWIDLFRGNFLRRTWITATLFTLEQTNGNQFVQSYAATFYVQQGLAAMSFTYALLGQIVGAVGAGAGIATIDLFGRRPQFIVGSIFCAFLLYLASGLGLQSNPSEASVHTLIACFILLPAFTRISATNCSFLTGAEIGGVRMRKKIMAFGTACDVAAAFLVTFTTPYILPSMGVNIGWIFGSVAAFSVVWGALFFPELKGRSLEEVDELFAAKLHAWQFSKYQTKGAGHLLTQLEKNEVVDLTKGQVEHDEDVKA